MNKDGQSDQLQADGEVEIVGGTAEVIPSEQLKAKTVRKHYTCEQQRPDFWRIRCR